MSAIGIGVAQGALQGVSRKTALDISAAQNEANAERADEMAAEVVRAGQKKLEAYSEKVRKAMAASMAAVARKHIDLGSGLANAIRQENRRVANLDLLSMQNNITNNALRYRFKAGQLRTQAKIDKSSGKMALFTGVAAGTLKGLAKSKILNTDPTDVTGATSKKLAPSVKGLQSFNRGGMPTSMAGEVDGEDTLGIGPKYGETPRVDTLAIEDDSFSDDFAEIFGGL